MDSDEYGEYLQMQHELYYTSENRVSYTLFAAFKDDVLCKDGTPLILSDSIETDNKFTETEDRERLLRDIEALDTPQFEDVNLFSNLNSVFEDYFVNGLLTEEECRKELASRVYLYMNE